MLTAHSEAACHLTADFTGSSQSSTLKTPWQRSCSSGWQRCEQYLAWPHCDTITRFTNDIQNTKYKCREQCLAWPHCDTISRFTNDIQSTNVVAWTWIDWGVVLCKDGWCTTRCVLSSEPSVCLMLAVCLKMAEGGNWASARTCSFWS
jgi:hypothetical protein